MSKKVRQQEDEYEEINPREQRQKDYKRDEKRHVSDQERRERAERKWR